MTESEFNHLPMMSWERERDVQLLCCRLLIHINIQLNKQTRQKMLDRAGRQSFMAADASTGEFSKSHKWASINN